MTTKRVLCLAGGGMKGFLQCAFLAELEKRLGKQCCEIFDGIAGTSIGFINAGMLSIGVPAKQILNFYTEDGPEIFKKRFWSLGGLMAPMYDGDVLTQKLKNRFGDKKLSDSHVMLLGPSYDLVTQRPYFFKSYREEDHPDYWDAFLWQAARASASAQVFFPAYRVKAFDQEYGHVFWDGGNVANNPSACMLADMYKKYGPESDVKVLYIGCGDTPLKIDLAGIVDAGAIQNGELTLSALFDAGQEEVDYLVSQVIGKDYYCVNPTITDPSISLAGANPKSISALEASSDKALSAPPSDFVRFISDVSKVL